MEKIKIGNPDNTDFWTAIFMLYYIIYIYIYIIYTDRPIESLIFARKPDFRKMEKKSKSEKKKYTENNNRSSLSDKEDERQSFSIQFFFSRLFDFFYIIVCIQLLQCPSIFFFLIKFHYYFSRWLLTLMCSAFDWNRKLRIYIQYTSFVFIDRI